MLEVRVVMEGEGGEDDDGGRIREDGDGDGGGGGGDRSSNGHRWPRHETMALLKIRSDMDVVFKESSLKGPLWEEVSRKMAGLGYQRNAKKCKEKFENIYKYHKRTKEGRAMKKDGKNYRFSDQLDALAPHQHHLINIPQQHQQIQSPEKALLNHEVPQLLAMMTTTSIAANPTHQSAENPPSLTKDFTTSTTSSSFSSGEESKGTRRRKRKMESFFENLMKDVMEKQENLQKKFLEVMEKRDRERMVREESWKMQEIARMNREHEILAHERAMAAARDAAVMAFLNKISEQSNQITSTSANTTHQLREEMEKTTELDNNNTQSDINGDQYHNQPLAPMVTMGVASSRWPKSEVEALISLRTGLDRKYAESSQKGPLWEEVSAGMKRLGYDRNAKKCKEKWENINKYFKKVRESNKRRAEDSKTCPYYDQLDAIYKEKMVMSSHSHSTSIMPTLNPTKSSSVGNKVSKEMPMQMVIPTSSSIGNKESSVLQDRGVGEHGNDMDDIDDIYDDDDDDGDEDEASGYEIAMNDNNASSMPIVE